MRNNHFYKILGLAGGILIGNSAQADTTINTFDNFVSDALYANWGSPSATIVSGPTSYSITASGYGSNYKYNPVVGTAGDNTVELTVTLSGAPAADGKLGVLINLVDGDGTEFIYAWYGQTLGTHVLTMPITSPTTVASVGTTAGLDLSTLTHLHMQLDPSSYSGQYTVEWQNLRLTGTPTNAPITITAESYNPLSRQFTVSWLSQSPASYALLYTTNLTNGFTPLTGGIAGSGSGQTTNTVTLPAGLRQVFIRVRKE